MLLTEASNTESSVSRFDLEQQIMECWNLPEDIENLRWGMLDSEGGMSEDEVDNYLLGMKTMYHIRFEKLFDTFEKLIQQGDLS